MGTVTDTIISSKYDSNGQVFSPDLLEDIQKDRQEPEWLYSFRRRALEISADLSIPDRRDEVWRRTDMRGFDWKLFDFLFSVPERIESIQSLPAPLQDYERSVEQLFDGLLVHSDGRKYYSRVNPELEDAGLLFLPLHIAVKKHSDLIEHYFMRTGVSAEENIFTAVHGALWNSGVFLYVPKNMKVSIPLQSVNAINSPGLADMSHTLIIAEEQSEVTLLNDDISLPNGSGGLHNGAVEIFVGPGANVNYYQYQDWDLNRWNFTSEKAQLLRDSTASIVSTNLGGKINKIHQILDLAGAGADGEMLGIEFIQGNQHADFYTQQNHLASNTSSNLLYLGALAGESRSVWRGNIRVYPEAQKTDGYQANHNLLLNTEARADSIPGLEIEADDVRCTHGSTAGNIEDDYIFYLMSRGLDRNRAKQMIVSGFFEPVLQEIKHEAVQNKMRKAIENEIIRYSNPASVV